MGTDVLPQVITLLPLTNQGIGTLLGNEQETTIQRPRFNNLVSNMKVIRNITVPTLTTYVPDASIATGTAVVICPGGGFSCLPIEIEGTQVAQWLKARGIAAFVLKYRLLSTAAEDEEFLQQLQRPEMAQIRTQIPFAVADATAAMKVVRQNATAWRINPQQIGLLGFSAGGVVAAGTAAQNDEETSPKFLACIYSPGSPDLSCGGVALPLFLAFASDDPVLSLVSEGTMRLYSAWKDAAHPVEMHIYAKGGHGFGMARQNLPCDHWIERFYEWLGTQ
jgi:acetyl esterase/lipase